MSEHEPMSGHDDARLAVGLILTALLTLTTYIGVIGLDFVWDDRALVLENPLIRDLRLIPAYFRADLWSTDESAASSGYYRPLMLLSLAADYALFTLRPAGYHLHSLLWHLLACGALALLLRQLVPPTAVLLGSALFALHPIQSETVVWIAARNDSMAATFALLSLWLVVNREVAGGRLAGAAMLSGLALLAKESVLFLPAALLVLDLARGQLGGWRRHAAISGGLLAALILRGLSGVGETPLPTADAAALVLQRIPQILALIGTMIAWPSTLSSAWSLEWLSLSQPRFFFGLCVLLLLAGLPMVMSGPRRKMALAGLAIAVMFYLPAVLPIASKGLVGERYLYLPMAGLMLWAVSMLPGRRIWVLAVLLPLCVLRVQDRVPDWTQERGLWEAAVHDAPNPFSYTGLAHALNTDDGDRETALRLFMASLADPLPYWGACGTPITAAYRTGRPALAAQVGWWSRRRGCPADGDFSGRMAVALAAAGDWEEAETMLGGELPDPSGRSTVVEAALRLRRGDTMGYDQLCASWQGAIPLESQVRALMRLEDD
ncbi:MAG: hypothetical protein ACI8RZ_007370 [Myxococcota bacterium]|jgi:hypothetical protein